jgi:DNA primase
MKTLPFLEAAETVKSSLDIVDVVSRHVVLKKAGRNHLGLCPFHPEKSPSFNVNREKNFFKCFGCGEAGDSLTFLMKRENKTYGEIIRELAQDQGIDILPEKSNPEQYSHQQDTKQKIYSLNNTAQEWFTQQLKTSAGQGARDYLAKREIPETLIEGFGLGLSLPGWENLSHYLSKANPTENTPSVLLESGLVTQKAEGSGIYDRFRNRLMIPIHDDTGRVCGFGGRSLSDEDKPKYLNSPETPVYLKNKILYGLFQAKESIRQSKYAVVMEGYFDVITAHGAGITQAIGSCGTALSDSHLKLLTRMGAETVYLAFDNDDAGLKASMSAIGLIEPFLMASDLQLKIVVLPDAKDPDEFIHQFGGEAFLTQMKKATSFLDFKFEYALRGADTHTQEGRIQAANRITPLIAHIKQPLLRSEMLKKYAHLLHISEEALTLEVRRYERPFAPIQKQFTPQYKSFSKKSAISKHPRRSLISDSYQRLENLSELRKPLSPNHLSAEKSLFKLLLISTESLHVMLPFLMNELTFQAPNHLALIEGIRSLGKALETESASHETAIPASTNSFSNLTLEGFIRRLQDLLMEHHPEPLKQLADYAFSADSLVSQLQLEDLSAGAFKEKVLQEAAKYKLVIENHQQSESLRDLANQARSIEQVELQHSSTSKDEAELSMLELQYQLRENLSKRKKELR